MPMLGMVIYGLILAVVEPGVGFVDLLSKASGPTFLAIVVVGAINEWWVPGRTHRRIVAERDELLRLALVGQEVGGKALDTAGIIAEAIKNASMAKDS